MHIDLRSLPNGRSIIEQKAVLTDEQAIESNVAGEVSCRAVFDALQFQILASVSFSCDVKSECARCLKPVVIPVSGQFTLFLK